jgi:hydroxymethylglutaryl-CoA reductase
MTELIDQPQRVSRNLRAAVLSPVGGFSKFSKIEKINYIVETFFHGSKSSKELVKSFWAQKPEHQELLDAFSENTLTNFHFPYGVCPNVLMNNELYCVPMVIEESSVVAACSKASKFWLERGGFKASVVGSEKIGQVHLIWPGKSDELFELFEREKASIREELTPILSNMERRGGGLLDFELRDHTDQEAGYYQVWCRFETCDAMGANFINSVLEAIGRTFKERVSNQTQWSKPDQDLQVVMAILSNYTPDCRVKASVECSLEELEDVGLGMSAEEFVAKFERAVRISKIDVNRATTHNKGIFNGIDSVVLATGNDFRAVEACGHTYAARDGQYRGLTDVEVKNGRFKFTLEIPLSVGTVGGLTGLHPMANFSLDLLGRPSSRKLMQLMAALKSLVTYGIQKGHMKMHLMNILKHLEASEAEEEKVKEAFAEEVISFGAVRDYLGYLRQI